MEPEIKPERKLGYGNQGVGAADHTDTRVYFLKNKSEERIISILSESVLSSSIFANSILYLSSLHP